METFVHVCNERILWELYSSGWYMIFDVLEMYLMLGNVSSGWYMPMIWYWNWRWYSSGWYMIFGVLEMYLMTYNVVNCLLWWWYTYCMILVLMMIFQWLVYDIWCFGNVFNVWKRLDTYLMNVYVGNCIVWWWYIYTLWIVYYDDGMPMIWYCNWKWYSSGWYMIFDVLEMYLMFGNVWTSI